MNKRKFIILIFIAFFISACGFRGNFGITKRIYNSGYNICIPWLVKSEPANNNSKNKYKKNQDTSEQLYGYILTSTKYICPKKRIASGNILLQEVSKHYNKSHIKQNQIIKRKNNTSPKDLANSSPTETKRKFEEMSIVSFVLILLDIAFISLFSLVFSVQPVFLLIGFGFIGIIAIILGSNGLKKIDSNPDKYKGEFFAIIGKFFGLMFLGIALVILILRFLNSTSVN